MFNVFEKKIKNSLYLGIALVIITFFSLIITAHILNTSIEYENIMGFLLLAIITSSVITVGAYFKRNFFFLSTMLFNIAGITYMLYVSINHLASGWSDLVSIISYLMMFAMGMLIGIITELIIYFMSKTYKKTFLLIGIGFLLITLGIAIFIFNTGKKDYSKIKTPESYNEI
jgi:hypothetical protein